MYTTLSIRQPTFTNANACKSLSSATPHFLSCNTRIWKILRKQIPYKDISNEATQGGWNLAHVCLQNDLFEQEALAEDNDISVLSKFKIEDSVDYIKEMLESMDDGQISVSPYDTAWVALIRDVKGRDTPQFPSSLDWVSNNQLADGSWGDQHFFLAYDRLLNTLACVVALRYWNVHADKSDKGLYFIKENISKLGDAKVEHMTCGFEIVFPALLKKAKELGIDDIPYDDPVMQQIFAVRDRKIKRVPRELLHKVPTCLLHNLEGLGNVEALGDLDWDKLLKLQTPKGSYITSPAASAFAIVETNDSDCLEFIDYVVNKFNGGAPTVYPVDIYARLWAVDRLQRLGISRFFEPQIKNCMDHVYRFWTEKGVFSARESEFCDIDDTSMGFRLLRLLGYKITPDALKHFKKDNDFTCYVGQGFESVSPIFNLYRASQVQFPGETVLEEARDFSYSFLTERSERDDGLLDKWLISKHLPNEIKCGLEMPWYASLPRVETRLYIDNYGVDDIWIGKTLYRMPEINDPVYLELAKSDYIRCQAQHQAEWSYIQHWYDISCLEEFGISKKELLLAYYLAAASIFEPERSAERLAWVKSQILSHIFSTYFCDQVVDSSNQTTEPGNRQDSKRGHGIQRFITVFTETLQELTTYANNQIGRDISSLLFDTWGIWLKKLDQGNEKIREVEQLVATISICGGHIASRDIFSHSEYRALSELTNKICHQLKEFENPNEKLIGLEWGIKAGSMKKEIEEDMQLLVQLVLQDSDNGISKDIKQTFLVVAKTFYYRAYFPADQIEKHVSKILFEQVV